MSLFFIRDA